MSANPLPKLYVFTICPFCERVLIAAAEKKLNIETIIIPRDNIPDWYVALNPNKTVPLLQVDNKVMLESEDILKYIDNITEANGELMGSTPFQKHRIEFFLSQISYLTSAIHELLKDPYNENKRKSLEENVVYLENIIKETQEKGGDYYCDDKFTAADIMLLPFLIHFKSVLSYYSAFDIFENAPCMKKIWAAGRERASVKPIIAPPNAYIVHYQHMLPQNHHLAGANGKKVLYNSKICPFANRVRLACLLRTVPIVCVEIDLSNIPSWYRYINPRETVPTLLTENGQYIHESMLIVNYVDRVAPATTSTLPLLPIGDADKEYAVSRFTEVVNEFTQIFYALHSDPGNLELKEQLVNVFKFLHTQFDKKMFGCGPFFGGKTMNICDVAFLPFLVRLKGATPDVTNGYDAFKEFPFLEEYLKACLNTEAKNVFLTMQEYLELYKAYVQRLKSK
ncbi:unnamed protein product [Phytomonas sp. Hart1]|nr:unnamed protein product [Phytomonas sp. Hart1]|eukprot:CCW67598.1 unnamed protein product [Phytomonas sp. isolate Hart1]